MKLQAKHLSYLVIGILLLIAFSAAIGHPIASPEVMASLGSGAGLMFFGNTSLVEIKEIIEKQGDSWKEHKRANDARLGTIEKELGDFLVKAGRPNFLAGGGTGKTDEVKALEGAAMALLTGNQTKADSYFLEAKAMSAGSDPDGGYVVHDVLSTGMTRVMAEISPIYRLARKIPMPKGGAFEEPVDRESAEANWVGETTPRDDTATPKLGAFRVELKEICAMPKATQTLIDIASLDVLGWLQGKVGDSFATKESNAFHSGDGVARPRGLLTYTTAATSDATRAWGTIQHIATGVSAALPASDPADILVDMVTALKPQYRNGAVWLMNRSTAALASKIKDLEGRYIWQQGLLVGQPSTLLGYPVEIDEDMPDIAAGSLSIAFGNVQKAYTIIEQPGTKYLTDPYTDKPNVRLFAYRRVGGGVNNTEAIKLLKFS